MNAAYRRPHHALCVLSALAASQPAARARARASFPDASTDAGADRGSAPADIDIPTNCLLDKEPKDSSACVADRVGIFVDAAGGSGRRAPAIC